LRGGGVKAPYTSQERLSAYELLMDYMDGPDWADVVDEAFDEFWGEHEHLLEEMGEQIERVTDDALDFWTCFDRVQSDGMTLADHFLQDPDIVLRAGERRWLEGLRRSSMRLYEVVSLEPGRTIRLRELLAGHEVTVNERSASRGLRHWDLLAARIVGQGASGGPELDGGVFPLPRQLREGILRSLRDLHDRYFQEYSDATELEFRRCLPPVFFRLWLEPMLRPPPALRTSDGQEMLLSEVHFAVRNTRKLIAALGRCPQLERGPSDKSWTWLSLPDEADRRTVLGQLKLARRRLVLETFSRERAERGRQLVEQAAGDLVVHKLTSHQHPEQALKRAAEGDTPDRSQPDAISQEELAEAAKHFLDEHYRKWIDMEIPALDGLSPRQAARSPAMRTRVVEMLKDLEHMYQQGLERGEASHDPHWMWAELGLAEDGDAPAQRQHPPVLAHESLQRHMPGAIALGRELAERRRARSDFGPATVFTREVLEEDLDLQRFIQEQLRWAVDQGLDHRAAGYHANLAATHVEWFANYELHLRKTFWVDEPLAWMLDQTDLDVRDELLRVPFASYAVVFTDRHSLGVAERLLSQTEPCSMSGRYLQVLTVYVTEQAMADGRGLHLVFLFDALEGDEPYLLARDLVVGPGAELQDILASHFPDVDADDLDPLYASGLLARLCKLVINATMYATSAGAEPEEREPAGPRRGRAPAMPDLPESTSEKVFFLPGRIPISQIKKLQKVQRSSSGRKLMHRFMVRGHWRRPNPSWKDQRLRWIEPYWKGPELAVVLEREYSLKE